MEANPQQSQQTQQVQKRASNGRVLSFAIFVGVPAAIFWLGFLLVGLLTVAFMGEEDTCNIARVPMYGILTTTESGLSQLLGGAISSADSIVEEIEAADEDEMVRAIVVDIDSPGGLPVAADEIMQALADTTKPTVAVIRDLGASAAYWAAAGADYIISSPVSNVGSVGVTMSYLESASSTELEGSRWIELSSGDYKDAGHPERTLKPEEEEHFQTQVDVVHDYMVDRIAETRTAITRDELAALADGRAYVGARALDLKLVDALGGMDDAVEYIATSLSTSKDELTLCSPTGGGLGDLLD